MTSGLMDVTRSRDVEKMAKEGGENPGVRRARCADLAKIGGCQHDVCFRYNTQSLRYNNSPPLPPVPPPSL